MFDHKKIFIFGMARSGYEVAKLLAHHDCRVVVTDLKAKEGSEDQIRELESLGIKVIIGENQLDWFDDSFDYLIKNPGVAITHPLYEKAKGYNIPVINEVEVAYHYLPEHVKIIGITGSNGKTTTTTITYEFLNAAGLPAHIGGNIGIPLSALVEHTKEGDILVLEISGHQLHDTVDFKTDISVMTNLTQVHLDHFGTYENYMENKCKIFRHHTKDSMAILNADNEDVLKHTSNIPSEKIYFSSTQNKDICVENGFIVYRGEPIVALHDIRIKGMHNYENIMCAIAAVKPFGVSNEIIKEVLNNFVGVEHRMEFVRKLNSREFYNDSKATNVKSTQTALSSFTQPTILLLGGLDRQHSFDELEGYMTHVKEVISFGETKHRIKEFCDRIHKECFVVDTIEEAVKLSYNLSEEGDVILLSPACAAWDQYENFEVRGNEYKKFIELLQN